MKTSILKRALSSLLALMLVATTFFIFDPTALFPKAEAAILTSQAAGGYNFKVTFNIDTNHTSATTAGGWGEEPDDAFFMAVKSKTVNGRNSSEGVTWDYWTSTGEKTWSGGGEAAYDGGFPTGYYLCANDNQNVLQGTGVRANVTKIEINDTSVWEGTMHVSSTNQVRKIYVYASGQGTDGTSTGESTSSCSLSTTYKNWTMPALTSVTYNVSNNRTIEISDGDTRTEQIGITSAKDQYGVNWGFDSVRWSSSNPAATIDNSGNVTYGYNGGTPYDVTFTPTLVHSTGNTTAQGITVHVKPFDVQTLTLNTEETVALSSTGSSARALYEFTPASSGKYVFFTYDYTIFKDSVIAVYKKDTSQTDWCGEQVGFNDDYTNYSDTGLQQMVGATDRNLSYLVINNLEINQPYIVKVYAYSNSNSSAATYKLKVCQAVDLTFQATGGTGTFTEAFPVGHTIYLSKTGITRDSHSLIAWSVSGQSTETKYKMATERLTVPSTAKTYWALWYPNSPTALTENSAFTSTITDPGQINFYSFTPTSTRDYVIYSTYSSDVSVDSPDPFLIVYDAGTYQSTADFKASDDDGRANHPILNSDNPTSRNFLYEAQLTAGTTYLFGVKSYRENQMGDIPFRFEPVYTVQYNANGGSNAPDAQNKYQDRTLTLASDAPYRGGYAFLGWSTSSTATAATYAPGDSFTANADTVLYAVWAVATYQITYNANGGTLPSGVSSPRSYNITSTGTLGQPTRNGYKFLNWKVTESGGNWPSINYTMTDTQSLTGKYGNVTIQAQWSPISYELTYDVNGGTLPVDVFSPVTYNITSTDTLCTPTRNGYRFDGWNVTTASGNWEAGLYNGEMTLCGKYGDVTLRAQWALAYYIVTFDGNGGTAPASLIYNMNYDLTLPAAERNGYTFSGWKPAASAGNWVVGTIYSAGSSVNGMYGNVTLKAQWTTITYTLSFDSNGGSTVANINYNITSTTTLPLGTRSGYQFTGWKAAENSGAWVKDTVYTDGTSLTGKYGSVAFVAQWAPCVYTIKFDVNGGDSYPNRTYTIVSTDTLGEPIRNGCSFTNWKVTASAGNWASAGSTYPAAQTLTGKYGNVSLQAQWTFNNYTLSFNTNGGNSKSAIRYKITDTTVIGSATRSGYTFVNWIVMTNAGNWGTTNLTTYTSDKTVENMFGNATLKAQWAANQYTMTFDVNGGVWNGWNADGTSATGEANTNTKKISVSGTYGEADENNKKWPKTPTKTGYTFQNWTSSGTSSGTVYTQTGTVSAAQDLTVKAQWTINSSVLAVDPNTGDWTGSTVTQYYTQTYLATRDIPDPIKPGYQFNGWTKTGSNGTFDASTKKFTFGPEAGAVTTLTATWSVITYTISYDYKGGALPDGVTNPETYTIESEDITIANPIKTGFEFAGYLGTDITSQTVDVTIPQGSYGDRSFMAIWRAESFTLTFNPNGGTFSVGNGFTAGVASQSKFIEFGNIFGASDINSKTWPINPSKLGYDFNGWMDGETRITEITTVAEPADVSVTATWKVHVYSITYIYNGGSVATPNPSSYTITSSSITLSNPTMDSYKFVGWTGTGLSAPTMRVTIPAGSIGDRTYTATWEFDSHSHEYVATVTPPTCVANGYTTYTCECGDTYTDDIVPALGHDYGDPVWTWAADYSTATARFTCARCANVLCATDETADGYVVTEAGCEQDKVVNYTASVTVDFGTFTAATGDVAIAGTAYGHDYGEPVWEWAEDYSAATAKFTCAHCGDEKVLNADVEMNTVSELSCTSDDAVKYTATVTFGGEDYSDETDIIVRHAAYGHFFEIEWSWSSGSATATVTCRNCGETQTADGEIIDTEYISEQSCTTAELVKYIATADFFGMTYYGYSRAIELSPALGHDCGEPAWTWTADYSAATATFSCARCGSVYTMTDEEPDTVVVTPASCTQDAVVKYAASVGDDFGTYENTTDNVTLPGTALGHNYGEPEWQWANDRSAATATITCAGCGDTQTADAVVDLAIISERSCTESGIVRYEASAVFFGETYYDYIEISTPAYGHDYGEPVWTWAEDYSAATATFTCARCGNILTVTDEAPATTVVSAAACGQDKVVSYTASVETVFGTFADTAENIVIPGTALAHTYGGVEWDWADNYAAASATFTCTRCGHKEILNAAVEMTTISELTCTTNNVVKYTATATFNGVKYTDVTGEITRRFAPGHTYEITWDWASDYSSASATITCARCGDTQTESAEISVETVSAQTCTTGQINSYTASAEFFGFTYYGYTGDVEVSPAAGHTWGEWVITVEPTVTDFGERKHTCTVCSATETEILDKLPDESRGVFVVSGATGHPGRTVSVTVSIQNNPGIVSAMLRLNYDPQVLTLVGVENGCVFSDRYFNKGNDLTAIPYTFLWADYASSENHTSNDVLATLTFLVAEDAPNGETPITITYSADSTLDLTLQPVPFYVRNNPINISARIAGDANGDGLVNLKDVVWIERYMVGGWGVTIDPINADVDGSGDVSLLDAVLIARCLVGGWGVVLI